MISVRLYSQTPIEVADNTIKVSGLGEEIFYYGFAEGDQMVFSFEEVNGKELKEIEIIEYPTSSKFMDYKTKKVENKIINITATAIYKFRFRNSALTGRICKIKIQRIPVAEVTKNFNTSVYWETKHDTTFKPKEERYLVKREYVPTVIQSSMDFFVNSGSNATFKGGKSRISFPVSLPSGTVEWYYQFTASRDKEEVQNTKGSFNLVGNLAKLIDQTGTLGFGVDLLTQPPGSDYCDVYLLTYENVSLFEAKVQYSYLTAGTRENIKSGLIKMSGGANRTYYIGIKNPDASHGISVAIEVVAVVQKEEWATRTIQVPTVSTYKVPYLKQI